MNLSYRSHSGQRYPLEPARFRGDDGALLDLEPYPVSFALERIRSRPATLWRYAEALPFSEALAARVTLGEGLTPLVPYGPEHPHLHLKVDYALPTLSFKDRGAVMLLALALELGAERVVADSSGNAGTAVAAYAARVGLPCTVYAPASTSGKKLAQMRAHGAEVRAIEGSREDVAAAALEAAALPGVSYASHVYNPFFYEGTKTYAFELWEQLGDAPETLILPVGNGTLVLGAYLGFQQLLAAGATTRMPRMVAVQAQNCAPIAAAFARGDRAVAAVPNTGTEAEGIAIAAPMRGAQILAAVRATGGTVLTVSDAEVMQARAALARRGFYVEITSAVNLAGYGRWLEHAPELARSSTVLPLCGAGLKSG